MNVQDSARTALFMVLFAMVAWLLWELREVLLLVGFSAVLAFALDPLVSALERVKTPWGPVRRGIAAALVVLAIVALGAWALMMVLPQLARELSRFVAGAPASLERLLAALRAFAISRGAGAWLGPLGGDDPMSAAELLRQVGVAVLGFVGRSFGSIGHVVGLALIPVLAFWLLAEREAVERSALDFIPEGVRPRVAQVIKAIDRALRSYVRGQSIVCATMGVLVGLALWLLHVPVPALLGTVVAIAEVVPILGFWTASLAIVLAGWAASPEQALWGWLAYLAVNQGVSLLVTPRVMGRHMKLHPFVVIVSILSGGALLGAAGAVLALPLAAAVQSVVSEFARRPDGSRAGAAS
ncbi:MAG TPA: AI-2E family transporter [Candidatus Acidoferrales bacterium]|nr:AI-2E family transporter [Candidatus Acidoferrales bacterium]